MLFRSSGTDRVGGGRVAYVRAYLSNCGSGDLNEARDAFIGEFDSWTEVADQLVDDCGLLSDAPALLVRYFDYEAYGRDLSYDGFEVDGFYFWSR